MNTQQFWKGLLMAVIAAAVSVFSIPINLALVIVNIVSAILVYAGKNLIPVLHSNSPVGELSLVNIISGVLVAIGTGIVSGFGQFFFAGGVHWAILGTLVLTQLVAYFQTTKWLPPYNATTLKLN